MDRWQISISEAGFGRLHAVEKVRPVRHVLIVCALDGNGFGAAFLRRQLVHGPVNEQRCLVPMKRNAITVAVSELALP